MLCTKDQSNHQPITQYTAVHRSIRANDQTSQSHPHTRAARMRGEGRRSRSRSRSRSHTDSIPAATSSANTAPNSSSTSMIVSTVSSESNFRSCHTTHCQFLPGCNRCDRCDRCKLSAGYYFGEVSGFCEFGLIEFIQTFQHLHYTLHHLRASHIAPPQQVRTSDCDAMRCGAMRYRPHFVQCMNSVHVRDGRDRRDRRVRHCPIRPIHPMHTTQQKTTSGQSAARSTQQAKT